MFKKYIILLSWLIFGLAVALPLEKGDSSKRDDTDRTQKQKELVEKLGGLVTDLLKRPETSQFLNMFKDNNGEYNFDLSMLLENGNIISSDEKEEGKEIVTEGTGEIVKRSEDDQVKEANKSNPGGFSGMGDYTKFIPGGMGGSFGDSKKSGGMDFMSFIPGGFGKKKRSESTAPTITPPMPAIPLQMMRPMLPPMPGAGVMGYNPVQGVFDPFAAASSSFGVPIGVGGMTNQIGPIPDQSGYMKFIPAGFAGKKREEKVTISE